MHVRRRKYSIAEGDMTPMIDMTFQLIAFFMVLVNFSEAEQSDLIRLPESELAKPPEKTQEQSLLLQITKKADVLVTGQQVPLGNLKDILYTESELSKREDVQPADVTIIIRADSKVATGKVQELIKYCQEVGYEKFALKAKEKQDY